MLILNQLCSTNFGPYKGEQKIDFPQEGGVLIMYGENMKGKTSFLNALRYAFFGRVLTRSGERQPLMHIENWDEALQGRHGFKVALSFSHNGIDYELTRECKLRDSVSSPKIDADFEELRYLTRKGEALSQEEANDELERILPENVSRFFLFDGEMLQQYEELLHSDSEMGQKIKEAIERILGVPILTTARITLNNCLVSAQKKESLAARNSQATQELGTQLDGMIEKRMVLERDLAEFKLDLESLRTKKMGLEEEMAKYSRLFSLFKEKKSLEEDLKIIEEEEAEEVTTRKDLMAHAWKGLLSTEMEALRVELSDEIDAVESSAAEAEAKKFLIGQITDGLTRSCCPTCTHSLSEDGRQTLEKLKADLESKLEDIEKVQPVASHQRLVLLNKVGNDFSLESLENVQSTIDKLLLKKYKNLTRIGEIKEETKTLDESEQRRIKSDHDKVVGSIKLKDEGIKKIQQQINETNKNISKIQNMLEKLGGTNLSQERNRRNLTSRILKLLKAGVHEYRERLREKVEEDASDLFVKLSTEPEYVGLKINTSYGLSIVHEDRNVIPVRSAGAEHIVALSLMGALQKNAPLQGPIIMDSPFGRLDEGHTTKVIQSLPSMAHQVMLLVFTSEMLNHSQVRTHLKGYLKGEYMIQRQNARHSTIEIYHE